MCFLFQENCACYLLMAAENKTGELSCSPAVAEGHRELLNTASQANSPVWLSGASVAQSCTTSSPQTPVLGAVPFHNVPTVHFTGHPFAVCTASSVSTTTSSFSPYKCHATPTSSCLTQDKRSVRVNPIPQQQNVVSASTVPTVRLAAQPAAVLDLSNNGILSTVFGRLPNVGTMVVHQLDPGSMLQKNVLAMIDNRTRVVTTATAVINMQPGLSLSYQGTVAVQPPRQVTSQIIRPVSPACRVQQSLQPVVVHPVQFREPLVACSLTAKQPGTLLQSSATVRHTCIPQLPSVNLPIVRPTVVVRTIANSGSRAHLSLSVAASDGSRFPSANSAEMVPRIKLPHTSSSLPGAIVRCQTTTAMHPVQPSPVVLANQPTSKIHHSMLSLPVQTQLVATVPSFVTSVCRNGVGESSNTVSSSSTLPPSESLTTLIPVQSTPPFVIPQSDVKADCAVDYVTVVPSAARLPLVAGSTAVAVCRTDVPTSAAHLAASLIHIPACTNVSSSSVLHTHTTFASYLPQLPVARFPVPAVTTLLRGQVRCSAETKKRSVKRTPRRKTESFPVFGSPANANHAEWLKQMFHSSAVDMPVTGLTQSVAPTVNPLPHTSTAHPTLMAGVKRKCIPEQKYTLLLENGCKYSSVYFDGEGFQAKKPAVSSLLTGNCYHHALTTPPHYHRFTALFPGPPG